MAKGSNKSGIVKNADKNKSPQGKNSAHSAMKEDEFLFRMNYAPKLQQPTHWFQLLPVWFFTAVVIMIVRLASYERPMGDFYWSTDKNQLTDFFSYYKMVGILICVVLVLIILLYRVFIQSLSIKKSFAYLPMIVYSVLVILSYIFSDYKLFALWGFNERFEGTLVLLGYMVMLFYIINSINTEKDVKSVVYSIAATSTILGLLGITQAMNHDFFKTILGKKLITPSWFWDNLDSLNFTFTNQIYQTVYNINYVSFYLTLLIPIFGLLFIRSVILEKDEPIYKKVIWGSIFSLLLFNLIGSASSSGLLGMVVVVVIALFVLNKRLLNWWKPIAVLLIITALVGGLSAQRWMPELTDSVEGANGDLTAQRIEMNNITHKLDSLITKGNQIILGYANDTITFETYPDDPSTISIVDSKQKPLGLEPVAETGSVFRIQDERYNWITVQPGNDDKKNHYVVISTDGHDWPFQLTQDGPKYYTGFHKLMELRNVPAVGWKDNQSFGTGRGYIWSRTIPMISDTILIGHGADTYCLFFPQDDYVGKYNSGSFSSNVNIIVDKPHSMYFGYIIGTGLVSVMMLFLLWFAYIIQSVKIYRKKFGNDFKTFTGLGIFLGVCGFLSAAVFNDSTVSVTPVFYGLLGTGIAINIMLNQESEPEQQ